MYNIQFKESVSKDLKGLNKKDVILILDKIENELPLKALSNPVLAGRFKGLRKFRIGDYILNRLEN